jgi:predicted enzyme related to lactoylglutathione lyase
VAASGGIGRVARRALAADHHLGEREVDAAPTGTDEFRGPGSFFSMSHTPDERRGMDWKLEVIVVPVADVDRAKKFYSEQVGFNVDVDHRASESVRIVQLTPPGSACSITIGTGLTPGEPGTVKGLQLCVSDIDVAHAHLTERGVDVSEIRHVGENGEWATGKGGPWNSFCFFDDPDGNSWAVQEKPAEN